LYRQAIHGCMITSLWSHVVVLLTDKDFKWYRSYDLLYHYSHNFLNGTLELSTPSPNTAIYRHKEVLAILMTISGTLGVMALK